MSRNESPLWKSIESLPPRADGDFRYGLINQSAFADRMKCIEALKVFNRCALLDQPLEGCVDRATPFLIAMDVYLIPGAKAQALINFCNEACYGSALSILDSPLSIQELAETLTQRCDVVLSDGSEVMLRYFDARVMDWLMDALEPTQLASFVSCATVWRYAGREGVLEWAAAPAGVEKLAFSPPLHLSRIQTIALRDAGIADAVLDILTRSNLQQLLETPYPFRYPLVQRLITAARNWNLGGKSDLVAYCTVAIESGPDFDQLPPWDQLMPKVKNGEISFSQALVMAEEHSI